MEIIIIPAYEPGEQFVKLVREVVKRTKYSIVVVDDGSGKAFGPIFDKIKNEVVLLRHKQNYGKGHAMKTALSYINQNITKHVFFVFMDADGQHSVIDAISIMETVKKYPDSLVLGVRKFEKENPWKSKIGNAITKKVFWICSGTSVQDTQTGLRGASSKHIPQLLKIEGERYEYEMNMLLTYAKTKKSIVEVPIETIYLDKKNAISHFHSVKDSYRIYRTILLFTGSSLLSFLSDYIAFLFFTALFRRLGIVQYVIVGNILARIISATLNYSFNRNYVFESKERIRKTLIRYIILAFFILICNTSLLYLLSNSMKIDEKIGKVFVEIMMFFVSMIVQQSIVF